MSRKGIALTVVAGIAVAAALVVAGLAGAGTKASSQTSAVSGSVSFDGIWTSSTGQKQFKEVIKVFNKKFPNVHINYKPVGNDIPTVLTTAVAGGHPPDMADIAQPGLVAQFAKQGKLKPITYAQATLQKNFAPAWTQLGTFSGKLYAIIFKAANKSLVWYNVPAFKTAGVKPPKTWAQLLKTANTLKASGTPAYSLGGAEGWTLTDLFENVYLRTFGPKKYNALSAHKIKWTDPSVITALKTMAQIYGDTSNIAGGTSGAIQTNNNDSITNAFSKPPKGAMVFEGDFVASVITQTTKSKPLSGFNVFTFPAIGSGSGSNAVEIAGDLIVTFRDNPAIRAFETFLATPQAAAAWAKSGGFSTGNHNMSPSVFPDPITRATAVPVANAKSIVFDLSDNQPASFGATAGQGEWGLFQDFLKNPKDAKGIAQKLESAAAKAYKKAK
jgi:ABC-type glycerol-3-phosphate transport system substrate-binding protein